MTAIEMARLIGLYGFRPLKGSTAMAQVRILDVKDGGWGRTLVETTPCNGYGSDWHELDSVSDISALKLNPETMPGRDRN